MKAVIAVDLDRTLIYSAGSAGPLDGVETVWVEDYDGAPLSLMTAAAHESLVALSQRHHVVPVTTRSPEQLARVRVPGRSSHAICANGGVLIVDGVRDRIWDRRVREELSGLATASEVFRLLSDLARGDWVRTVRQVEDLFVYLVAQTRADITAEWLADLESWTLKLGWCVSVQGRKVYVVPERLGKGPAALRVTDLLGSGPLLAAGDSLLDVDLLEVAQVAVRPRHGELHDLDWTFDGLRVTDRGGACAAEDVLELLGREADALVRAPVAGRSSAMGGA